MEPEAERLMAECFDKNMIDKDEYPQTAEIETRCVNMLADLWHAPDGSDATGCSTTGSSEAAMLGGLALKRRWQQRRRAAGQADGHAEPGHGHQRPGLLGEVRALLGRRAAPRADGGRPVPPHRPRRPSQRCDENTIGVVAILGLDVRRLLRAGGGDLRGARRPAGAHGARRAGARRRRLGRLRRAVHPPRPRVGLPAAARRVDQRLRAQVRPRLPGRRLGRVARRRRRCPRT